MTSFRSRVLDLTRSGSPLAKKKQLKVEDVFQVGALEMDRLGWLVNLVTYPSVWPAVTSMTHQNRILVDLQVQDPTGTGQVNGITCRSHVTGQRSWRKGLSF